MLNTIPLNVFFIIMSSFFVLYLLYYSLNFVTIVLNVFALLLVPGSIEVSQYYDDPMFKIMLLLTACFISGSLIIYNLEHTKKIET